MKNKIFGYGCKVITLAAQVGKLSYQLSDQQRLGLPQGAEVIGFGSRFNASFVSSDDKSINGNSLITNSVGQGLYLNIRGWSDRTILANVNLFNFSWFPDFVGGNSFYNWQPFIEPIAAEKISWNRSNIFTSSEIANNLIEAGTDIELHVLYRTESTLEDYPQASQVYPNGVESIAYKTNSLEIPLSNAPQIFFPFTQDGKSSINDDAVIFGIRALSLSYTTPSGRTRPNQNTFGSTFITLQAGRTNILENFPIRCLFGQRSTLLPYFPLEPLLAGAINWQDSKLFISDNSRDVSGTSILLNFYYQENC